MPLVNTSFFGPLIYYSFSRALFHCRCWLTRDAFILFSFAVIFTLPFVMPFPPFFIATFNINFSLCFMLHTLPVINLGYHILIDFRLLSFFFFFHHQIPHARPLPSSSINTGTSTGHIILFRHAWPLACLGYIRPMPSLVFFFFFMISSGQMFGHITIRSQFHTLIMSPSSRLLYFLFSLLCLRFTNAHADMPLYSSGFIRHCLLLLEILYTFLPPRLHTIIINTILHRLHIFFFTLLAGIERHAYALPLRCREIIIILGHASYWPPLIRVTTAITTLPSSSFSIRHQCHFLIGHHCFCWHYT